MGLLDQLKWLRWLLSHGEKLPVIIGLIAELNNAPTRRDKWLKIKVLGDLVIDILDTMPNELPLQRMYYGVAASLADADAVRVELTALEVQSAQLVGLDWRKLVELLPEIIELVRKIIDVLQE